MLIHAGWECKHSLATILLSTPRLLAGEAVDHPGCVDDIQSISVVGLPLLAFLDVVTGGAVTTHPLGTSR